MRLFLISGDASSRLQTQTEQHSHLMILSFKAHYFMSYLRNKPNEAKSKKKIKSIFNSNFNSIFICHLKFLGKCELQFVF